jgi:CRISPR-associated protein Cas5t
MNTYIIKLYGVSAHFRDPRFNTGGISNLPLRTLYSPPPCTIHGLICAAKGGWVEPDDLIVGWKTDYASSIIDFQTCWLPQRKNYSWSIGTQKRDPSPREREFLAFPCLTLLVLNGVNIEWFYQPANPLCLGRSEDLVIKKIFRKIKTNPCKNGIIKNQCLPLGLGFGTIYPSPLYFDDYRIPVKMAPRIDVKVSQEINHENLIEIDETKETFYLWNFKDAVR